jgi:hypothetical protein
MPRRARVVRRVHRHNVTVRFSDEVYGALGEFASQGDLDLNCSVRELVQRGLAAEAARPIIDPAASLTHELKTLGLSALACLIATEQNQKLLISMLPDGAQLADDLWEEAATSARTRLIRIEAALAEETR